MNRTHGPQRTLAVRLALTAAMAVATVTGAVATAAAAAPPGQASTPLDRYLDGLKSLATDFTQQVVDAHGTEVEAGAGKLLIARPGKFRWEYAPVTTAGGGATGGAATGSAATAAPAAAAPAAGAGAGGAQLLVADGRNLWFYDRELMQVTVKPMTAALGATPVALLSGTAGDLRGAFAVDTEPAHDGLEWVRVKPRSAESDFQQAELGFKAGELASMVIEDKLGQHATLRLTHSQRNGRLAASEFEFKPPPGTDVIGAPQPP
jgi:outer membrane lipoprotein carrier protein